MKETLCGIYKIENLVNRKVYIGKSFDIYTRWYKHEQALDSNKHYNKYLQRSWNKYGKNNFVFSIVELCDLEDLSIKEIDYILLYNSKDKDFGYNLTNGGEGIKGYKHTINTKRKLSEMQIGKKRGEEELRKFSLSMKGKIPKNINILLKHNKDISKSILCFNENGNLMDEFISIQECGRILDIPATNIVKCLNGIFKTCNNFVFIYKDKYSEEIHNQQNIIKKFQKEKRHRKGVIVYDLQKIFIKQYSSIIECSLDLKVDRHYITNCCLNKINNYKEYIFEYVA